MSFGHKLRHCAAHSSSHSGDPALRKPFSFTPFDLEPVKGAADSSVGKGEAICPWFAREHRKDAEVLRKIRYALAVRRGGVGRTEETFFAWVRDVIAERIASHLVHSCCIAEAGGGTFDVVHRMVADGGVGGAEAFFDIVKVALDCLEQGEEGRDSECGGLHG